MEDFTDQREIPGFPVDVILSAAMTENSDRSQIGCQRNDTSNVVS